MKSGMKALSSVVLLLHSSLASAAMISFGPTTYQGQSNVAQDVLMPQFDPTLGTLKDVFIEIGVLFPDVSGRMLNVQGTPVWDSFFTVFVTEARSVGGFFSSTMSTPIGAGLLPPGYSVVRLSSGLTFATGSPITVAPYIGFGDIAVSIATPATSGQQIVGTSTTGAVTFGGPIVGHVFIKYTYHAVPEPATLVLLGLGLAGLGWSRRNRA